jgi:hypothetical protein
MAPANAPGSLSVKDVMRRVETYVQSYGEKASIVVATEQYVQTASRFGNDRRETRTLTSDFAIVRAYTIRGWLGFRDVLEVDGRPVADRDERLARVLMASQGRYDEARRLSDESARYNIGSVERNFNVPTTTLFFFVPDNHDRFKFAARGVRADGSWEIAFTEREKPTLIRTPEGRSIPSSGSIDVLPENGVVLRTLLKVEGKEGESHGTSEIDVRYARVESLGMWLPASMDESYEVFRSDGTKSRVTGHADYSNYRTFTTSVRIK